MSKAATGDPQNQRTELLQRGMLAFQAGQLEESKKTCEQLLALHDHDFEALYVMGLVFYKQNSLEIARELIERSTKINPLQPQAFNVLGNIHSDLGRLHSALKSYSQAVSLNPTSVEALNNLGLTQGGLRLHADALGSFKAALDIEPHSPEIYFNQGNAYDELGQYEEAVKSYRQAISLRPHFAECHNNCGIALKELKLFRSAIDSYIRAIHCNPSYADAYNNRGIAYKELGLFEEARKNYDSALELEPENPEFLWNKSQLLLLLGEYEEGWRLYESRWSRETFRPFIRSFTQPMWQGEKPPSSSDTILLHAEQGLGDSIQMLRYVPIVAQLGWKVVLELPRPLVGIASNIQGVSQVLTVGDPLPRFKTYAPLMSLPSIFHTTVETIPSTMPYLSVAEEIKQQWQERLGSKSKYRVGICWAGSPKHKNDYNRSIALKNLSGLFDLDVEFFSLQKEKRKGDQDILDSLPSMNDYSNDLTDFSQTAGLIEAMDLVISVDTSVAHIAAALGKPVWIMLLYSPDFRWLTKQKTNPWYPSARLFRQEKVSDWELTVRNIKVNLQHLAATSKRSPF